MHPRSSKTKSPRRRPRSALRDGVQRALVGSAVAAAFALLAAAPSSAGTAASAKTRVTVIGDSIMASFDYVPSAARELGRGLELRSDNAVCRRLVAASCPYGGSTPATALDVVRANGRALGQVVVINVDAVAELSAFELEHGIGPVKEPVVLGPVDAALAATGKGIFEQKCSACHKMESKYVGPALGEVTTRRSPAFIMNMILNPMEMVERHPVGKQLLAEHMTFMADQNLTQDDARVVLEYLRTQAQGQPKN